MSVYIQEGQRVLDIVNGENATMSKAQKRAAETATLSETSDAPLTVVSTADGAKVLNNLDELTKHYDNLTKNNAKTFSVQQTARHTALLRTARFILTHA